ncbi:hypothetical protein [Agromyces sp. LHK192]|uniref:Ig-like domain-containing protein n=1 Tax=Agromyces sp. LHK192 TaxID=2498704 RepID=UPI0013E289B3|nr:hypothetical protein [Agromyces sp. LHK192]
MLGARWRGIGAAAVVLVAVIAAVLPSAASDAGAAEPVGPTAVEVPYGEQTTIEPVEGWQITDCGAVTVASPLVVECTPERIVLRAASYDPDAEPALLPVPMSNGRTSEVFPYTVTLGPPEPPSVHGGRIPTPVAAGSTVLIPFSDLGVECAVCSEGGAVDVVDLAPASAGTVGASATHLVLRPRSGYAGTMEVLVRWSDDFGGRSPESKLEFTVYRPLGALTATSVYVAGGADPIDLSLLDLVFADDGVDDVSLISCGPAVHGSVVCAPDGTARYSPAGASVDQFAYRVASADGEQATGSVTIVGADAGLPTSGLVPAGTTGREAVASAVVPRVPVDDQGGRVGVFVPLIGTLDRLAGG